MADFIQDLADKLAKDVLDLQPELGNDRFYEQVGKVLGEASPTLQEVYMTSIRIRMAEARGREFLDRALKAHRDGSKPPAAPLDAATGGH